MPMTSTTVSTTICLACKVRSLTTILRGEKRCVLLKIRRLREQLLRDGRHEYQIAVGASTLLIPRTLLEQHTSDFVARVNDAAGRFLTRCDQAGFQGKSPLLLVGGALRLQGLKESLETLAPNHVYLWNQSDYATVFGAVEQPELKERPSAATFESAPPDCRPRRSCPAETREAVQARLARAAGLPRCRKRPTIHRNIKTAKGLRQSRNPAGHDTQPSRTARSWRSAFAQWSCSRFTKSACRTRKGRPCLLPFNP